jgi:hypothetical protein
MALFGWAAKLFGEPIDLNPRLLRDFPELGSARYRRGGAPPYVGGWCLGARSVAAIALGRTVWIAREADLRPDLLLHEHAHVEQWRTVPWFAVRYVWESVRRGYVNNRFEIAARQAADARLQASERSR